MERKREREVKLYIFTLSTLIAVRRMASSKMHTRVGSASLLPLRNVRCTLSSEQFIREIYECE